MPRRRCVGCGRIAPKSQLLRIVAVHAQSSAPGAERTRAQAQAVVDTDARLPGRGAYLCLGSAPDRPAQVCLDRATKRNAIARALRRSIAGWSQPTPSS